VVEALIVLSVEEARNRGIAEISLGMTPRIIGAHETPGRLESAMRAMYWSLDRFQRSRTLHQFKDKFDPSWQDRYLVVPSTSTLPEVIVALARAHVPPLPATLAWLRSFLSPGSNGGRPALA
jgi:phosphatidylglycerol lysyltransferase